MLLINKIIKKLIRKNISISTAESCTGGLLSSKITSIPGVSKIFYMGLITYSNNAKKKLLKIKPSKIKKFGAVSREIAIIMVNNLQKISKSKICISITGIAGPSGGTRKKPVGLVYIGIKYRKKTIIINKKFKGSRKNIQNKTIEVIFKNLEKLI